MKAHLLFSASGIGLVYLLVGSLPLAAMPLVPEKQTLGTEELKELETEISLNTSSVDNPVKIPGIDELKPADAVEVENTGEIPPSQQPRNSPLSRKRTLNSIGDKQQHLPQKIRRKTH